LKEESHQALTAQFVENIHMETRTKSITQSFRIYLTPEEKAQMRQIAADARMSMSTYTRTLLLGGTPPDGAALAQIDVLAKAIADLNRLGGLMKMLLTNAERLQDMGRDMAMACIDGILADIRFTVEKLEELIDFLTGVPITGISEGTARQVL
jgi:hypothetical protein